MGRLTVFESLEEIQAVVGGTLTGEASTAIGGYSIDTRHTAAGDLFIGIPGAQVDGGTLAPAAAAAGAAAALVSEHAAGYLLRSHGQPGIPLLAVADPVAAVADLAISKRRSYAGKVFAVTGSTGKTSTKDILGAILAGGGPVFSSAGNRNTEIGMPLEVLAAPLAARAWVLELAMRGEGEIAELTRIAAPDAGCIVNVGPVHLESLGSIERVAAAKAELIAGLEPGAVCVTPAGDALLSPYLRADLDNVTFGPGGDCRLARDGGRSLIIEFRGADHRVEVDFDQPHNRLNLLAAAAAALACGFGLPERLEVAFSSMRGQREAIERGVVVINDCYNANPMSMRAALADLAEEAGRRGGRRIAVLGDMLELGGETEAMHLELGRAAGTAGVDLLVSVGRHAGLVADRFPGESLSADSAGEVCDLLVPRLESGDTVLIKGSRGVGLERVLDDLRGSIG